MAMRQTKWDADTVSAYGFTSGGGEDVMSGSSGPAGGGQKRLLAAIPPEEGEGRGRGREGDDAEEDVEPTNVWGLVTNIHLCDLAMEGTLESMEAVFCPFRHLREFDVDGNRLTGRRRSQRGKGEGDTHRTPIIVFFFFFFFFFDR